MIGFLLKLTKLMQTPTFQRLAKIAPPSALKGRLFLTLLMLLLTTMTAWATSISTINVGGTDYTLFTGFTATGGSTG